MIDRQPGCGEIAIWVTSRGLRLAAANVNAVTIDLSTDQAAFEKVRSLTRSSAVLVTNGTSIDDLPIGGLPLREEHLTQLRDEITHHRERITEAVRSYKKRTRSKALTWPSFAALPARERFTPSEDTPAQRAFSLANYLVALWSAWLHTDEERRRRTVQPRTNASPWIMPEDMNDQSVPDFPPEFMSHVIEQPLV